MDYKDRPYFHVAHARDLTGWDKILYRILEIIPGLLAWSTLIGVVVLSFLKPVWAAIFIIIFDLFWLLKTAHLSMHHFHNWRRMKHNIKVDWSKQLSKLKHEDIYHLVLLPFYNEGEEVITNTIDALIASEYNKKKILIVLATEERAGQEAQDLANKLKSKYGDTFGDFLITTHPSGIPGEIMGKGPNITHAAEEARKKILDFRNIDYKNVLVSAFDIDTVVWPKYFACLTWNFLTVEDPQKSSFQPVPLYNNNLWQTHAVSRVAALTSSFWQMIQQERPEKLVTFSSHAIPFKALYEVGYWQKNMVSDDSRIFWNLFMANDGNYKAVPISYPVSMDANLAPTTFQTFRNIFRQHARWMWGVENLPYMIFGFIKNKKIQTKKKIQHTIVQLEGFWSLTTNPIMIMILGWLPIVIGGEAFRQTILSYNLPIITRTLMTVAMTGLILSAIIATTLVPKMPQDYKRRKFRWVIMFLQWGLVPFTIIIFGSLPGLLSQTRLMLGRYVGKFWVTPKHRK
jgi:cellulose synthase/poly-beta-1,6-N-acetylglucosamine synthase-like glycosyltransferase